VQQYSDDPDPIKKQNGRLPGSGYYEIQEQLTNLFGAEVANRVMTFKPNKDFTEPLQDKEKKGYYIYAIAERTMAPPPDFDKKQRAVPSSVCQHAYQQRATARHERCPTELQA
jgi:hypothetical protein